MKKQVAKNTAHVESLWRRKKWVVVIVMGQEVLWSATAERPYHRIALERAADELKKLRRATR